MDSCLAKGVTTLVVVSAGFAESGVGGLVAERKLVDGGAGARHAGDRAQRARRGQHRPRRAAQRHAGARAAGPGPDRVLRPVRRAGHRDPRRRAHAAASACRRSCRRATGPTCPATTCCSTGRPTRHRTGAALPGDVRQPAQVRQGRPAARPHQARSSRSRAGGTPGRSRRSPTTPSRSTTPACGRCSSRRASSGSRRSPSCSTPRCCWPTSRCPTVRGSRWSATPPLWACWSPTRCWGRGCSSRATRSTWASARRRRSSPPRSPRRSRPTPGPTRSSPSSCRRSPPRATPTRGRCGTTTCRCREAGRGRVLRRGGRARRAGGAGRRRHAAARVGAQLRQPGAGRGGVGRA